MLPPFSTNPGISQVNQPRSIQVVSEFVSEVIPENISRAHIVSVPRADRWRIYYRLQELTIPCWCLSDGTLRVEVQDSTCALLLRSVVQQFVASRQEIVNWLEQCWNAK